MISVDDVIAKWSPKEKEKLKDLIEECKKRERRLAEVSKDITGNLEMLAAGFGDLVTNVSILRQNSEELLEKSCEVLLKIPQNGKIPTA